METVSFRRAMLWLFGDEGDIATDSGVQVPVVASTLLITGSVLVSPLISDLATVFGVSETRAGLLMIAYTGAIVVSIPVMGTVADRVGRKTVFVPGLVVFGIAGAAIGFAPSFEAALALRVLQAIGFASSMPIAIALLGDLYRGDRETTAQGIRTAAINIVIIGVPVLSGVLFVRSWRYPFFLYLGALPIAVWAWIALPRIDVAGGGSLREYVADQFRLLGSPAMALLVGTFVMRQYLLFGFLTYVSVLAVRGVGLSVVFAGAIVSVKGVLSLVSSSQAGRAAVRYSPRVSILAGFLFGGAGYLAMGSVSTPATLVAGAAVFAIGDGIVSPSQKSLVNRTAPVELRGGAVSVATTFQNVGKVIGPAALGALLGVMSPGRAFVLFGGVGGAVGTVLILGMLVFPDR